MACQFNTILSIAVLAAAALAARLFPATNTGGRTKSTVAVVFWNNLEGQEDVEVDCADAEAGGGSVARYGESTKLEVRADREAGCRFGFKGEVHLYKNRLDVYQNGRDEGCGSGLDRTCNWVVKENGPCFHDDALPQDLCFPWD